MRASDVLGEGEHSAARDRRLAGALPRVWEQRLDALGTEPARGKRARRQEEQ